MPEANSLFRPETIDDARERLKNQSRGEREAAKAASEGQLTNKSLEDEEVLQGREDEINEAGAALFKARELTSLDVERKTGPGRTSKPNEAVGTGDGGDDKRSAAERTHADQRAQAERTAAGKTRGA